MKKPRNKVWGFIFSLLPGAGHMYLGLLNQGLSYMLLFIGFIAVATLIDMPIIAFACPIIWFYSFFDYMNKEHMNEEEAKLQQDRLLFFNETLSLQHASPKAKRYLGWTAVAIGSVILWEQIVSPLLYEILNLITGTDRYYLNMSAVFAAIVIIVIGIKLIRGRKKQLLGDETHQAHDEEE